MRTLISIKFGEIPAEITENSSEYDGDIGKGWIQVFIGALSVST